MSSPKGRSARPDMNAVVEALIEDVLAHYRAERHEVEVVVTESVLRDRRLEARVLKAPSLPHLRRTRAFRQAQKIVRKKVYYALRRYQRPAEGDGALDSLAKALATAATPEEIERLRNEILKGHASTRERLPDRDSFLAELKARMGQPRTILDVGCGVFPLLFPLNESLTHYVAADRDSSVVAVLEAYSAVREPRLVALPWNLEEGWDPIKEATGIDSFDLAFLFKLVPVIARQEARLLPALTRTPARTLVVTGSRRALTRRRSIERRERRQLQRFASAGGFHVTADFTSEDELGVVLERL